MVELLAEIWPWIVVTFCLFSEAFFAAAELSMVSVNRLPLEELALSGDRAAQRALWFKDNPERLFGTTLIGTNASTVTATTVASLTLLRLDPVHGEWWAMALMSPLILLGAELLPKSIAQARALSIAQLLAGPLYLVHRLLLPAVFLVRTYTTLLYRVLHIDEARRVAMVSRDELAQLMESESSEGDMNPEEREMISRIFAFGEMRARDTMIPLTEMVGVSEDATVEEATMLIAEAGFSRLPVYCGRVDDVVGILHHLDLLRAPRRDSPVREFMRPPHYVPESRDVDDLLVVLQREAATAAIVVDEFGGAVGLITLEDILEEIVGDIQDEFDHEDGLWRAAQDGGFLVSARAPVDRLNEAFNLQLPEDESYETISGYLIERLRLIPRPGHSLTLPSGAQLTVRRGTERVVQEVHLTGVKLTLPDGP